MSVENQLKTLPEKPGCYMYFNKDNKVIYVGKAKNLKKRVSSYFTKAHDVKTTKLVRDIVKLETIITLNEKESLLLEQNLIKKYKPRYNIVLNDDKNYPYIAITNEKDPEYIYVRNYNAKNKKSFGPFPDGSSARKILRTIERIYPLRRCKGNLGHPCTYYYIQQCSGACFKEVEQTYYENQIKKIENFFLGVSDDVQNILESKMLQAAKNLQFEEAQRIKEIIEHLKFTTEKQDVDLNDNINRDIFNYYEFENYICFTVLFYRSGKLSLKNNEVIKNEGQDINDLFKSYILQIYTKNLVPDFIGIPIEINVEDLKLYLEKNIINENDLNTNRLLNLAKENAKEFLFQKLHYANNNNITKEDILKQLQVLLKLDSFPYHIEMYDVANMLDEYVTGAMVVFKNGIVSKNDFRKYNIEINEKGDYHRIKEMIYRRYSKDADFPEKWADLLIMDGGIIQVHAAKEALKSLNINIPIMGLVKNDNHKTESILDLEERKIEIDKKSDLFKLLENFQLRVHNYAISGFRKRQQKGILKEDYISKVKGLGDIKIKKLYENFKSISSMQTLSVDQLNEVIKNKKIAEILFEHLKNYKR
ncbi:excinuclease ABC subunit UvrC [Spiroplasma tabanidicola]|uniref:UvrABC system protein C n=1 Tax=Spiroplasma tabanidicola TaxID=324079 RepID=A0A6I6C696_9MOLU|nr:excinuclease ABC subunit UvrC [Spiroplasma tabanidicola]QGS51680.1 excinuclease ABC subunit C [Spiroplasma tabanidicola]